jgi:hypothetical protein
MRSILPALLSLCIALPAGAAAPDAGGEATAAPAPADAGVPIDELRILAQVLQEIRDSYVEEMDDRTLLENAATCRSPPPASSAASASRSACRTASCAW